MRLLLSLFTLAYVFTVNAIVYDLSHLSASTQNVCGPLQDDEGLFIFSLVRGMRLRTILEIGGLSGYSALNFLAAMSKSEDPILYTVDINPVPKQAVNHITLTKDARHLTRKDLGSQPLDLIFFDCHEYEVQMSVFHRFKVTGIINNNTVIMLHDTDLHPHGANVCGGEGAHQPVERHMVNSLRAQGYDIYNFHTRHDLLTADLLGRHGVSVATIFKPLSY